MRIDTVLLKVASRCNLNCSYCYVYNMGDASWRHMPKRMSEETESLVTAQLSRLCKAQDHPFAVVLHGGEPLLLGARRLQFLLRRLRAALPVSCSVNIQTNGVLITPAVLDICANEGVSLSVSLDGPADIHDCCRVDLRGRATHAAVIRGIRRLQEHPQSERLFSGVLAVVSLQSSPATIYAYFKSLGVPSVDFLYRDGNRTSLPDGKASVQSDEYGRWMAAILREYCSDPAPLRIRVLDDMMKLILGGSGVKEGVGLTDFGILVVDTDGSATKNDTLKSSPFGDRFEKPWNVHRDELTDLVRSPEFMAYHAAQRPTSAVCCACPELAVCGGGMVAHRYDAETGYDNPSVFCADQKTLIAHMRERLDPYLRSGAPA